MNPHDIKALLGKRGVTQISIARKLKVSPTLVGRVIFGRVTSRRVASEVAQSLGLTEEMLWPSIYGPKAAERKARH